MFLDTIAPSLKLKIQKKLFEKNLIKNQIIGQLIGLKNEEQKKKTIFG